MELKYNLLNQICKSLDILDIKTQVGISLNQLKVFYYLHALIIMEIKQLKT